VFGVLEHVIYHLTPSLETPHFPDEENEVQRKAMTHEANACST
jgi:hypothetical protein